MPRNTRRNLDNYLIECVDGKINTSHFKSTGEAVRADLQLLKEQETQLELLRDILSAGELQLDQGQGIDGERFMNRMIG